ncbi:hypothetical protein VT50_0205455 [Streptomyces antioxidans]|uniref:Uncharacterized protein n=1 Tax=Streptomyces antioxidans TaxID=1507734 RepID=A0A1V4DBB3_9ACTN|nr:hypothetical protein [Streptomyces antioxidans]OPF83161.1 hypothetical protein VT50_0205455 [Streptomyces antioxidans]
MSDTDWELFLRDLALCLSTYQDRGPAVVWPERAHTVLPSLDGGYGGVVPGTGWRPVPLGAGARRLAVDLGRLMGYPVQAYERLLAAGAALPLGRAGADVLLFPLSGGVRCRVEARGAANHQGGGLELRLRAGEMVFVPARHSCSLSEAWTPCRLLLLMLHATP